jgi:hypothetical protein
LSAKILILLSGQFLQICSLSKFSSWVVSLHLKLAQWILEYRNFLLLLYKANVCRSDKWGRNFAYWAKAEVNQFLGLSWVDRKFRDTKFCYKNDFRISRYCHIISRNFADKYREINFAKDNTKVRELLSYCLFGGLDPGHAPNQIGQERKG